MRLLFGHQPSVIAYIKAGTRMELEPPVRTIGAIDRKGAIVGAVAFTNYTGFGINITMVGGAALMRGFRQAICDYVFGVLGCRRLEITTRKSNIKMRRLAPRLGFTFEGRLRGYYGDEDAYCYSLLSNEAVTCGHWKPHLKDAA